MRRSTRAMHGEDALRFFPFPHMSGDTIRDPGLGIPPWGLVARRPVWDRSPGVVDRGPGVGAARRRGSRATQLEHRPRAARWRVAWRDPHPRLDDRVVAAVRLPPPGAT